VTRCSVWIGSWIYWMHMIISINNCNSLHKFTDTKNHYSIHWVFSLSCVFTIHSLVQLLTMQISVPVTLVWFVPSWVWCYELLYVCSRVISHLIRLQVGVVGLLSRHCMVYGEFLCFLVHGRWSLTAPTESKWPSYLEAHWHPWPNFCRYKTICMFGNVVVPSTRGGVVRSE
jgi:succinate-acetate transporter protein